MITHLAPDPVIRIEGLVKHYGRVEAVNGIDLVVPRGELLGFLGPNGAGKSTTWGWSASRWPRSRPRR